MKLSANSKLLGLALGTALVIGLVVASGKCDHAPEDTLLVTKGEEPVVVAAPDGLLADVVITTPNASWGKLQRGIGGAVGILPATAGGIVCTVAGLDPYIAGEIDGSLPAYAVIAADPGASVAADSGNAGSAGSANEGAGPGWVVAMKLTDMRKARGVLVDGDTARFSSRDAGGMTELVAKGQGTAPPVAVAFAPNGYLVLARRSEDLVRLAPYVTRTLPKRPLPSEGAVIFDVPRTAIGSVVKPKLEGLWASAKGFLLFEDDRQRREHAGRPPDFGDPKAIVGAADGWITRRIAVVGDLEKLRITVDLVEDGISVAAVMTPAAGGGPAAKWTDAMTVGDLAPIAALPVTSAAALLLRDSEEERADQARELEKGITSALGARLAEADAKKLHDVAADLTKARGDVLTSALVWDDPQGLSLRGPVRDADAASRAVKAAVDLAKVMPFKEIFRVRDLASATEDLPGLGKATLVTVERESGSKDAKDAKDAKDKQGSKKAAPDSLGLAWLVEGGSLSVATGASSAATLTTLRNTVRPERSLGEEPAIARTLTAFGNGTSAALVVQPLRLDPKRANLPAAPLVVALGRKEKDATLRIDVANGLLRELARWQMGL